MILPGKVIVIDDSHSEVRHLLTLLNKLGMPTLYFRGVQSELPLEPINNISAIFLDINLSNQARRPEEIKSVLRGVLGKILAKNNIPYIVYVWSKIAKVQLELVEDIFKGNNPISTRPIAIVECKKEDLFDLKGKQLIPDDQVMSKLSDLVRVQNSNEVFKFFQNWKSALDSSYFKVVDSLFKVSTDISWEDKVKHTINNLSVAHFGKKSKGIEVHKKVLIAKTLLGNMLMDEQEVYLRSIRNNMHPTDLDTVENDSTENQYKLNQSLLLGDPSELKEFPGNCFRVSHIPMIFDEIINQTLDNKDLKKNSFDKEKNKRIRFLHDKKDPSPEEVKERDSLVEERNTFIAEFPQKVKSEVICGEMVVTPICDFAQEKNKLLRVLPFMFIKITNDNSGIQKDLTKQLKTGAYNYDTNAIFEFKGNNYILLCNYLYLQTRSIGDYDDKEPFVRVKEQLLFDLQYRIASNMGRPGVTFIDHNEI